jgi:hypothetical protein
MVRARSSRWIQAALLFGVLVLAVWTVRVAIPRHIIPASVLSARASEALGRQVYVDDVELRLLPFPRVVLVGVTIEDLGQAARAEIDLLVRALFDQRLVISRLVFVGLKAQVERDAAGKFSLPGLVRDPEEGGDEPEPATCCPSLPAIEIVDATLSLIDHAVSSPGGPLPIHVRWGSLRDFSLGELSRFELEGEIGKGGSKGSFEVSGSFGPLDSGLPLKKQPLALSIRTERVEAGLVVPSLPPKWLIRDASGPMNARIELSNLNRDPVEGRLEIDMVPGIVDLAGVLIEGQARFRSNLRVANRKLALTEGTLKSDGVSMMERHASEATASFSLRHRTLEFHPLEFVLHEGQVSKTGSIVFEKGEPPAFDIELRVEGLDFVALTGASGFNPDPADRPRLTMDARLRGSWTKVENFYSTLGAEPLGGDGQVELRGGAILSQGLVPALAAMIPSSTPTGSRQQRQAPRAQHIKFDYARATFVMEDAVIHTDDLLLQTESYRVTGGGTGTLDGRVDLDTKVALTTRGLDQMLSLANSKAEAPVKERRHYPPIKVEITGPLNDLDFDPDLKDVALVINLVPWAVGASFRVVGGTMRGTGEVLGAGMDVLRQASGKEEESESVEEE